MSLPRLVGRYEFTRHVGKGGFGVVEEYRDLLTNEQVAIKTIPARFVDQESKRLVREIDTMSFLYDAHPHVIGFFSMFATSRTQDEDDAYHVGLSREIPSCLDVEGSEYAHLLWHAALLKHHLELERRVSALRSSDEFNLHIVMPLMKGDLLFFIKHTSPNNKFSLGISDEFIEQVAVVFAFQICFGLDYLHKCNIVHRDMKPENVLVRLHATNPYESTALIADLGLARDAQASETFYVCTRYYRPPEIITNVSRGETSIDVWSLGCILFEIVTGRALFTVNSALNEQGVWEGHRASNQLEVILNIIGTPSHADIKQYMPLGNAHLYLLRSIERPSRLVETMKNNWRLCTSQDRQAKWIDLICSCLRFFPEQRPTCEALCRHQLFQDCNVFYGENVLQHPAKVYQPTRVGTLTSENKQTVLNLVRRALQQSAPTGDDNMTDEAEESIYVCEEQLNHHHHHRENSNDNDDEEDGNNDDDVDGDQRRRQEQQQQPMCPDYSVGGNTDLSFSNVHPTWSGAREGEAAEEEGEGVSRQRSSEAIRRVDFPDISDPELLRQYAGVRFTEAALDGAVSSLLNDLQYHTHDRARSEQLRELLHYFTSLR